MDTFTDASWDRAVLASPVPVVVGFWAEWCVPCHMAQPALESAEQQHSGRLRFGLVNFDENPGLIERKGVAFPKRPAPGHELWRDVDVALEQAGYLSPKGLTDGRRGLTRDGREIDPAWKSLLTRLAEWLTR